MRKTFNSYFYLHAIRNLDISTNDFRHIMPKMPAFLSLPIFCQLDNSQHNDYCHVFVQSRLLSYIKSPHFTPSSLINEVIKISNKSLESLRPYYRNTARSRLVFINLICRKTQASVILAQPQPHDALSNIIWR